MLSKEEEDGWKMAHSNFVPALHHGTETYKGTSMVYIYKLCPVKIVHCKSVSMHVVAYVL